MTKKGGLDRALFDPDPRAFCDIAESGGEPLGFALWFYSCSTFAGRTGFILRLWRGAANLWARPAWLIGRCSA
jgi:hypothetical protein